MCHFDLKLVFHCQTLNTLHGQTLNALHGQTLGGDCPQQLTLSKFRVSLMIGFKPKIMCYLLGPYFSMFTLTNWPILMGRVDESYQTLFLSYTRFS